MLHLSVIRWIVLGIGAFGVGLSKTGIAGLGIVAVAVFALAIPAKASVGVLLPVLTCGDICAVAMYHRKAVWRHIVYLFPWAAVGVIAGFFTLKHVDEALAARLIGGILLALSALQIARRVQSRRAAAQTDAGALGVRQSAVTMAMMGILAGFTTMVANAAGPVMVLYLLSTRLPKVEFIGTGAWYFFVMNLFKTPFNADLGLINVRSLTIDACLAPLVLGGALLGRKVVAHIDQSMFELVAIVLTVAAAVRLVW